MSELSGESSRSVSLTGSMEYLTTGLAVKDESSSVSFQLVAYTLIGAVGIADNLFVIYVILQSKQMRKKFTNWFLVNQSVLDLLASVWMMVDALDNRRGREHSGILGDIRCRLLTARFLVWVTYMASTYNLVMISIERYFEIVHAIYYRTHIKWWVVCVMLILPYLVSCAYNQIGMQTARVVNGACVELYGLTHQWEFVSMGVGMFFCTLLIPIAIMCFCYIKIGLFIKNMPQVGNAESTEKAKKSAKASINVIKTLAIVCVMFFVCWVWNAVLFFLFSIGVVIVDFNGVFYHFTVTAVNINCLINPFIYTFKYEQFKHEAKKLFCKHVGSVGPHSTTFA